MKLYKPLTPDQWVILQGFERRAVHPIRRHRDWRLQFWLGAAAIMALVGAGAFGLMLLAFWIFD